MKRRVHFDEDWEIEAITKEEVQNGKSIGATRGFWLSLRRFETFATPDALRLRETLRPGFDCAVAIAYALASRFLTTQNPSDPRPLPASASKVRWVVAFPHVRDSRPPPQLPALRLLTYAHVRYLKCNIVPLIRRPAAAALPPSLTTPSSTWEKPFSSSRTIWPRPRHIAHRRTPSVCKRRRGPALHQRPHDRSACAHDTRVFGAFDPASHSSPVIYAEVPTGGVPVLIAGLQRCPATRHWTPVRELAPGTRNSASLLQEESKIHHKLDISRINQRSPLTPDDLHQNPVRISVWVSGKQRGSTAIAAVTGSHRPAASANVHWWPVVAASELSTGGHITPRALRRFLRARFWIWEERERIGRAGIRWRNCGSECIHHTPRPLPLSPVPPSQTLSNPERPRTQVNSRPSPTARAVENADTSALVLGQFSTSDVLLGRRFPLSSFASTPVVPQRATESGCPPSSVDVEARYDRPTTGAIDTPRVGNSAAAVTIATDPWLGSPPSSDDASVRHAKTTYVVSLDEYESNVLLHSHQRSGMPSV
ncbi:hypothetical protein R3P38DRAFT_3452762 [Favolaschia claudopus]|uniref:Uncharacterized protein n=1 Tax=Favolaschia claudopus TaxID=2862362 RepID=A0AAV9ZIK9_9AGAR